MAKTYGGRWRTAEDGNLGKGGQSQVYRVTDLEGEYPGLSALKRVINGTRRHRFLAEIEAIKRLSHPNIIQLIDHSALDTEAGDIEKQYLVMPIAEGGDMSHPKRLALYKDNIDSVIAVSKQITSALIAAHAANIIHRDVKPANILFTGNGHDVLLADFGICLIREQERHTEFGEVVGPRGFMAPEVEKGGQLDLGPEADIFSLGKVIYYMISGGDIVHRENIHEPAYREMAQRGGRYSALQSLLEGMICARAERIKTAAEVLRRLNSISEWDRNAHVLLIGERGLSGVEMLNQRARDAQRFRSETITKNERVQVAIENIGVSFGAWLEAEFMKVAAHISDAGLFSCKVQKLADDSAPIWTHRTGRRIFFRLFGLELVLADEPDDSGMPHSFQFSICTIRRMELWARSKQDPAPTDPELAHTQLVMLPFYTQAKKAFLASNLQNGFFTRRDQVGKEVDYEVLSAIKGAKLGPGIHRVLLSEVTRTFHEGKTQYLPFKSSEWIEIQERRDAFLKEAMDSFILFVAAGASPIGV